MNSDLKMLLAQTEEDCCCDDLWDDESCMFCDGDKLIDKWGLREEYEEYVAQKEYSESMKKDF